MDQFTTKQRQIRQRQAEIIKNYPYLWSQMIKEWRQVSCEDRAWLMYSANYLFRTNNVCWAMDPARLKQRLPLAPDVDYSRDLDKLSFVLLTHQHADHLDLDLIRALSHLPIFWVIPDFVLQRIKINTDISLNQIIVPKLWQSFDIDDIRMTPFDGLHWEKQSDGGLHGVPEMAYLIEFNDKRWLFPGDIRDYDPGKLPSFGPVDGLFAHVWLGRGCALQDESSMLDAFCRFYLDLKPRRIILSHLREFGRDVYDYWDEEHAKKVCSKLREISGDVSIDAAVLGDSVVL